MDTFNDVAVRLRNLRGFRSAVEMGRLVGITGPGWAKLEKGALPGGAVLTRLSELGFSCDWILTGKGFKERLDEKTLGEFGRKVVNKLLDIKRRGKMDFEEAPWLLEQAITGSEGKESLESVIEYLTLVDQLRK